MKVLCIGQSAYDITFPMDHYPIENKKIRIESKVECGGGSAANCATLLARWNIETYFAGIVGNDFYGMRIKQEFVKDSVNIKYLQTSDNLPTTVSYIIAAMDKGTRTILTCRNPNIKMEPVQFEENFDVILMDGYERDIAMAVMEKNPNAIKVLDAGSMKEATVELAHKVDYLVCSKDFAEAYTKMTVDYNELDTIANIYDALKKDFTATVVITLEDKGSFVYNDGYKLIPSIEVKALDSTGAGDIYHGAFTYCIAKHYGIEDTMLLANITGALSVQKIGGKYSIPTLAEVVERYNGHNL